MTPHQDWTPTAQGKEPIGKRHVGEKVLAYNPNTKQMEDQPILHVFLDHDNDLVDLTLTTIHRTQQGRGVSRQSEVIHTNQKHPFLTKEKGFLPVGQIKLGMHVRRADGQWGVVTGWKVVPGAMTMYNLEVAQDHTFTVGVGEWVVHNCTIDDKSAAHIFRDARGHLPDDTPDNRQLLISTASDESNYVGTDKYGNDWYSKLIEGGKQVWVQVRNGIIRNGGVNDVPRLWDPNTGFSSPARP
jgi:hypothetical protein